VSPGSYGTRPSGFRLLSSRADREIASATVRSELPRLDPEACLGLELIALVHMPPALPRDVTYPLRLRHPASLLGPPVSVHRSREADGVVVGIWHLRGFGLRPRPGPSEAPAKTRTSA
jgi:hypothetical protein